MKYLVMFSVMIILFNNSISAKGFGIDLGLNSKYQVDSNRGFTTQKGNGNADLEGSDIRLYYLKDDKLGFGFRFGNHSGNDSTNLCCGYSYKISVKENSIFARYGTKLGGNRDVYFEGYGIGGLNFATIDVGHQLLENNSASATTFMLEGGLFAGIDQNDFMFGGGLSLPLDGYTGSYSWTLLGYPVEYDLTVTKTISLFLIMRGKI